MKDVVEGIADLLDAAAVFLDHVLADVAAAAKSPAGAGEHQRPEVVIAVDIGEGFGQFLLHGAVNGVQPLGAIEHDFSHVSLFAENDILEFRGIHFLFAPSPSKATGKRLIFTIKIL